MNWLRLPLEDFQDVQTTRLVWMLCALLICTLGCNTIYKDPEKVDFAGVVQPDDVGVDPGVPDFGGDVGVDLVADMRPADMMRVDMEEPGCNPGCGPGQTCFFPDSNVPPARGIVEAADLGLEGCAPSSETLGSDRACKLEDGSIWVPRGAELQVEIPLPVGRTGRYEMRVRVRAHSADREAEVFVFVEPHVESFGTLMSQEDWRTLRQGVDLRRREAQAIDLKVFECLRGCSDEGFGGIDVLDIEIEGPFVEPYCACEAGQVFRSGQCRTEYPGFSEEFYCTAENLTNFGLEADMGRVLHVCDCLEGASSDCLAGDDSGGDGTLLSPWQTLQHARDEWMPGDQTIALCRGGSFAVREWLWGGCQSASKECYLRDYFPSGARLLESLPKVSAEWLGIGELVDDDAKLHAFHLNVVSGSMQSRTQIRFAGGELYFACNDIANSVAAGMIDLSREVPNAKISILANRFANTRLALNAAERNTAMTVGSPVFTVDRNRMSFDLAIDAQADCVDISGQCRADCEEVSGGLSGQCQRKGLIWIPNPSVGSVVTRNEVIVGPNGPGLEGLVLGTRSDAPAGSVQIEDNRIFNVHTGGIRFDAACAVCSVTNNVISIDTSKGTEAAAIGIAISGAVSEGTDDLSWNLLNNTVYFGNPRMSQETKPQRFGLFLPRRGRGHQVANNAIYADLSDQSKGLSCYGFWADPVQSLDDGLGLLRHSIRDRYRVLDYNACANSGDVNKLSWVNDLSWFIEGTMPGVFGTDQVTYERWTAPLTVMGVDLEEHDQYSVNNEDPLLNRDYQTVPTDANKRVYLSPLVVTSPLVDAGSALYTTPSGINFGVRGNMPDIGAFEFVE